MRNEFDAHNVLAARRPSWHEPSRARIHHRPARRSTWVDVALCIIAAAAIGAMLAIGV